MCVPAPTCKAALAEATELWPRRSRASDGICGDAAHQARKSDHNSGNAFDLTNDPKNGCDCMKLRDVAVADPRSKYVIHNDQINQKDGKGWVPYKPNDPSRNKHLTHMHVSILDSARDDVAPWWGGKSGATDGGGISLGDSIGIATDVIGGQVADSLPEPLASLTRLVAFIANPDSWLRVAGFVLGIIVAFIGVALLIADSKAGKAALTIANPVAGAAAEAVA